MEPVPPDYLSMLNERLKKKVADEFSLNLHDGDIVVYTPFQFADGDHFVIRLRKDGRRMYYTDNSHTLMHLSFWVGDEIIAEKIKGCTVRGILAHYNIERESFDKEGSIIRPIKNEDEVGIALLEMVQAITILTSVISGR